MTPSIATKYSIIPFDEFLGNIGLHQLNGAISSEVHGSIDQWIDSTITNKIYRTM